MDGAGGDLRVGDELREQEEADGLDPLMPPQPGSKDDLESLLQERGTPSAARLQPPASGQVPERPLSTSASKGGRGRGGRAARPAAAVIQTGRRPPGIGNGKRPAAVRPAAQARDTTSNGQADGHSEPIDTTMAVEGDDNGEEVEEEMNDAAKRKLTSKVWKEMKKVKIDGDWKAKCDYCHKILTTGPKAGTNHLAIHLKSCTLRKLKTRDGKILGQSSLKLSAKDDGTVGVENYTFDQEYAREQLGNMLVLHDYPLSIVDHAGFRRFVHALQPLFKLHTRNTYRNDIVDRYNVERKKAVEYMLVVQSRVAVTTDMWTADNQKKGYMAVTAHFIDESWKLRSILMRFIYVPAPHTADVIAEQLHESLVDWNIDEKLMTVTVDNCTTNDKAIELIVDNIGKKKLLCEGNMVHMRCCAHILNLIVKDGLDVMKSAIDNICESVAYWTATPKRWEKFEEMAKFKKVKITRRLKLDCKTRWNSTFIMLDIALPYRAVFERAKQVDKQYVYLPDDNEWEFATDVVDRLRLFYEITELFLGTDYVTANVYFPKICEIKMKMRHWATSSDPIIKEMTEQMNTKFDKYWKDIQGLMGIATLLDPRYKKQMLVACFAMLNGVEPGSYECTEKVDGIVASLHALLEEYEVEDDAYQPAEGTIISTTKAPAIMNIFHDIVAQQRPTAAKVQGEIEQYLTDALVPYVEKFNVFDWWKVAGTRYPTLRKVARDIFAIPVTTVASESAFSTSGRIINEHRSRLTSHMLEVLMCSQDWLRNKYKDAHKGEASFWTCLQDIQEGMEDLAL
ncbi:hypothetical protein ACQ4PT_048038 [Festuca glaucescens]